MRRRCRGTGSGTSEVQVAVTASELEGCDPTPPVPTLSVESHATLMLTHHARSTVQLSRNDADGDRRNLFSSS